MKKKFTYSWTKCIVGQFNFRHIHRMIEWLQETIKLNAKKMKMIKMVNGTKQFTQHIPMDVNQDDLKDNHYL